MPRHQTYDAASNGQQVLPRLQKHAYSHLFTPSSITRGEAEEDTDATKMDEDENCLLSLAIFWCFLTPEVGVGNIAAGAVVWFRLPGE